MNFRKYINVLIALFLLASNMGLSFNVHYCEDEIASITLNTASNSCQIEEDCCGEVERQSKCCKNKIIKSTEKSAQVQVKTISLDAEYDLVFNEWRPGNYHDHFNFQSKETTTYYCDANAPPRYLLYSQYTFYS
ncbi:MAG: hypothetical protein RIQ59_1373 [Bacteroidota bacterium]|jgi:hypothetical protein